MKLTAEQRVERAHTRLMQHKNFCLFAGIFMIGETKVSDDVVTAYTNGRDVHYGRKFVESLNDKQLAFLVVHEAMHKAYRHLTTWRKLWDKSPSHANAAADYVINLQIVDMDPACEVVEMPRDADGKPMGLLDRKYAGMDTKQVFDLLMRETGGSDGGDGKGSGGSQPQGKGQGQASQEQGCPDNGLDQHDWEGAASLGEKEEEKLKAEIDHALREGATLAGKMKGEMPRGIDELLHPKVDWREALRDFVKLYAAGHDFSTWRRPNRKYVGIDLIMPSTIGVKPGTIAVGIDTSGSIGGPMLAQFLGELKMIAEDVKPGCIELMYWDTDVASRETYTEGTMALLITSTKPRGGGGTSPECVPKYMRANQINPQCVVMLTDGYFYGGGCGDWSECSAPVLWCVVGNKQFTATIGKTVYVED